jgi:5-methylcytosine-specific restriction endonuclease McrA
MEITSRKQAKTLGLGKYFTGKPCPQGHVSERFTSSGGCVVCVRTRYDADRAENPEKHRETVKRYYRRNRERLIETRREYQRDYYAANKDVIDEYKRDYYENNKDVFREQQRKYREENKDLVRKQKREHYNKRRALKHDALLPDSDPTRMRVFYEMAECMTRITGVQYHVDHIIPLSKGGAHHQDNLQVMRWDWNLSKGNRLNFPSIGPGRYRSEHEDGVQPPF